jgi:hypothetical protein
MKLPKMTPKDVWDQIKKDFLKYPPSPVTDSTDVSITSACCFTPPENLPANYPKYFQRMFRSEAERGALQGELYHFLRDKGHQVVMEYKRRCVLPGAGPSERGDMALFEHLDHDFPRVVIELKHWSAFQSEFPDILGSCDRLGQDINRWMYHQLATKDCSTPPPLQNQALQHLQVLYLGFYTEIVAATAQPGYFSFLATPSYKGQIASYVKRQMHALSCKSRPEFLCPKELLDRFINSVANTFQKIDQVQIDHAFIDQIVPNICNGRLHCFAVWTNNQCNAHSSDSASARGY